MPRPAGADVEVAGGAGVGVGADFAEDDGVGFEAFEAGEGGDGDGVRLGGAVDRRVAGPELDERHADPVPSFPDRAPVEVEGGEDEDARRGDSRVVAEPEESLLDPADHLALVPADDHLGRLALGSGGVEVRGGRGVAGALGPEELPGARGDPAGVAAVPGEVVDEAAEGRFRHGAAEDRLGRVVEEPEAALLRVGEERLDGEPPRLGEILRLVDDDDVEAALGASPEGVEEELVRGVAPEVGFGVAPGRRPGEAGGAGELLREAMEGRDREVLAAGELRLAGEVAGEELGEHPVVAEDEDPLPLRGEAPGDLAGEERLAGAGAAPHGDAAVAQDAVEDAALVFGQADEGALVALDQGGERHREVELGGELALEAVEVDPVEARRRAGGEEAVEGACQGAQVVAIEDALAGERGGERAADDEVGEGDRPFDRREVGSLPPDVPLQTEPSQPAGGIGGLLARIADRVGLAVAVGALPAAGADLHAAGLDLDDETAAAGDHRERVELALARRAAAGALRGEAAVVVEDGAGRQRGEEVLEDGAFAVGGAGIETAGDQARHQALTPARRRAASGTAAVISRIPSPRRGTPLRSDEPFGQRRLAACLPLPGGP